MKSEAKYIPISYWLKEKIEGGLMMGEKDLRKKRKDGGKEKAVQPD